MAGGRPQQPLPLAESRPGHPRGVPPAGPEEPSCFPYKELFESLDKTPLLWDFRSSQTRSRKLHRAQLYGSCSAGSECRGEGAFARSRLVHFVSLAWISGKAGRAQLPPAHLAQKGLGAVSPAVCMTAAAFRDAPDSQPLPLSSTVSRAVFFPSALPAKGPERARHGELRARGRPDQELLPRTMHLSAAARGREL